MNIGATAYDHYPVTQFEDATSFIVLEGMRYDIDDKSTREQLFSIADELNKSDPLDSVKHFFREGDGEFIVAILNKKTKDLCVFNDALGRLPFFWYKNDRVLALSREIKFMYHFIDDLVFDRFALIEYLLFGSGLGERTLINGIGRIFPATALMYSHSDSALLKQQVFPLSFSSVHKDRKTPEATVEVLRKAFLKGLQHRVDTLRSKKPIIALSGGQDSRATLAGLIACGVTPRGITYDTSVRDEPECEYAQKIADLFNVPLTIINSSKESDLEKHSGIVRMFDATQDIGNTGILDSLELVLHNEGPEVVYYTGLYGGEMFRNLSVTSGLGSDDELIQILLDTPIQVQVDHEKICTMLQIPVQELWQHFRTHLSSYPEKDPYSKYLRFRFEEDYRWAGGGEDRNRYFFWTVTPFRSREFFSAAYGIDERKKDSLFFRNFLHEIDPRTCVVNNYMDNLPLNRPFRLRIHGFKEKTLRNAKIRGLAYGRMNRQKKFKGQQEPGAGIEELRKLAIEMLETSDQITRIFSLQSTKEVLSAETDGKKLQRIVTLFLYMDMVGRTVQRGV